MKMPAGGEVHPRQRTAVQKLTNACSSELPDYWVRGGSRSRRGHGAGTGRALDARLSVLGSVLQAVGAMKGFRAREDHSHIFLP